MTCMHARTHACGWQHTCDQASSTTAGPSTSQCLCDTHAAAKLHANRHCHCHHYYVVAICTICVTAPSPSVPIAAVNGPNCKPDPKLIVQIQSRGCHANDRPEQRKNRLVVSGSRGSTANCFHTAHFCECIWPFAAREAYLQSCTFIRSTAVTSAVTQLPDAVPPGPSLSVLCRIGQQGAVELGRSLARVQAVRPSIGI